MKTTFRQFLTESKIQIPAETHRKAMSIVAAAYFSDLERRMRVDGDEPTPEYEAALSAARAKYGDFKVYDLNRENPGLTGKVPFHTKDLPERYRKNLNRDFSITLWAGPRGTKDNHGEYIPMAPGRPAKIRINTQAGGSLDSAVYNPKLIAQQLHYIEATLDHELQHMVQDTALKRLHPSQQATDDERLAGYEDDDAYYSTGEEFSPQITSAAARLQNSLKGVKGREQAQAMFYDAVDPRRQNNTYEFFASLFKTNPQKWKKAVKELHRLVQNQI